MHEFSLMQGVFDSIKPVAQQNNATKVTEIVLNIGRMTEVVDEAMQFAFEALSDDDPLFEGCKLTMTFVEPRSMCFECGNEFEHDRFHLRCPKCGSGATTVIAGKEMNIASIEVESPDDDD